VLKKLDFTKDLTDGNRRQVVFVHELQSPAGELLSRGLVTFAPSKHLELEPPAIHVQLSEADGQWRVTLRAQKLARFVEVKLADADAVWSDNFFDLPAGREYVVTSPRQPGQTAEELRAELSVTSLWDSF